MGGLVGSLGVSAQPSLYPEARFVLYQILIRNASSQPLYNARVVPNIVKGKLTIKDAPKIIPKLNPNSSGTATFALEPAGEVDEVEVEGFMTYYRERRNSQQQLILPTVSFNFSLPEIIGVKISNEEWKHHVSGYFSDEKAFISHRPVDETLEISTKTFMEMGLAYIVRFKAEEGFVAERRDFYGVDKRGLGFAARILWRHQMTKDVPATLLVRAFSETEEGLFAFFHRILHRLNTRLGPQ